MLRKSFLYFVVVSLFSQFIFFESFSLAKESLWIPTDQNLTPAGKQILIPGRPNAIAISPDGNMVALNVGGYPNNLTPNYYPIVLVNLKEGKIIQNISLSKGERGGSYTGIVYSKDGSKLYASFSDGKILDFDVDSNGLLTLSKVIKLPESVDGKTSDPGGLSISPDNSKLYVALSRNNSIGIINLSNDKFEGEIPVGNAPYTILIDSNLAFVTNQGGRVATIGDYTNYSSGTSIISNPSTGAASTGTVSVVDLNTKSVIKNIPVGLQPTAMCQNTEDLFVTNVNNDTISVINKKSLNVVKTISVHPYPNSIFGSQPNAIAIYKNKLYVSLGSNNAIAVYDWNGENEAVKFDGLIPTGWYPGDIAFDKALNIVVVANIKGVGSLGKEVPFDRSKEFFGHSVYAWLGSISIVKYPDEKVLSDYTKQVYENNNWNNLLSENAQANNNSGIFKVPLQITEPQNKISNYQFGISVSIPLHSGELSAIKHVFYIIKENRPYDQVFGDIKEGNGDPKLVLFGEKVTPNQHALAKDFVLFDNFYCSGSVSADGHQFTDQGLDPDYVERQFGDFPRSYPNEGGDSLAYLSSGFIWEDAVNHGKSVANFGEYVKYFRTPTGAGVEPLGSWQEWYKDSQILEGKISGQLHIPIGRFQSVSDVVSNDKLLVRDYPPFCLNIPDQYRVDIFLRQFDLYLKNNDLPNLIIMSLPNDHTGGTKPGLPTPEAMVADNDLALGRIVDAISHSKYWKDSIIFVVEDDAQNGVDHVDGHRTIALIIGPYVKRNYVDHTKYTQIDMLRTIEQILGLPPMNQMDSAATPMYDAFTDKPDFTPYDVLPNKVPLDEMNPDLKSLNVSSSKVQYLWALASKDMFSGSTIDDEDKQSVNLLNRDIWYSVKGFDSPYPGDNKVFSPNEAKIKSLMNNSYNN
ncbi:40-residue YVTN family beta-propeller repeat protein [Thermodesulfobium narugense DSM 14796]|uniref:40-residue YVTN family beta-propeller repeat protein n=1 Tax=Thermodesulfobium narugense DSM 14796 TaxID=747365 RepID=M1E4S7_9BACT|nr:bifunctional YncE family protein/alkaline phosphatase family protein [Thermodesulfobium narugense]AEE14492.1 40-residue YVTN family beta-propeller repeat protein [Thermodesulfobium narugense DSM 14796]